MNRFGNRRRLVWGSLGAAVLGLASFAVGVVLLTPSLKAEDAGQTARAVRLSRVDGQVQVSQGNQVIADPALANAPLFEGSHVVTGDDGRAEIQFEDGSVARLSPNSGLTLTVLRGQEGTGEAEIVLESGLGYFELVGTGRPDRFRVRFGDSVVTASGFTVLRINLDNPPGDLAVFSGNAHLERGNALTLDLHGGESVALNRSDLSQYSLAESIEPDSWDTWNADRDQELTSEAAARTGATNNLNENSNPAWNDLDANGNWYNVPGQGYVWSPYDAANAGWDPYGSGNWMWTPGYGYLWVSNYSWGYMPFQCGAWNYYNDFGWGWAPGMAGCSPWWGLGGIYYGPNIGIGYGGYLPPLRPGPPRHGPHQPVGRKWIATGVRVGSHPVVPVNRRPSGGAPGLPARDRTTPVVIAGHPVQPLRALPQRPQYDRAPSGYMSRPAPVYSGARSVGAPGNGPGHGIGSSYPSNSSRPGNSYAGSYSNGGSHSASPSSHASSGGGYSGGYSGGSVSHSSGGGGFSGGGGGGGGGGSHGSGGGGGGGSSSGGGSHR